MWEYSRRETARALGIDEQTLRHRIKTGKITWPPASIEALQKEWALNKDLGRQSGRKPQGDAPFVTQMPPPKRRGRPSRLLSTTSTRSPAPPPTSAPVLDSNGEIVSDDGIPALSISQRREAAAKARERELKVEELEGRMVDVEQVRSYVSDMLVNFKSRMMAIPANLGHRLAGESDVIKCTQILKETIVDALTELSEYGAKRDG